MGAGKGGVCCSAEGGAATKRIVIKIHKDLLLEA